MSQPGADPRFLRSDPRAGFVNPARLPKGPNGRALCRECGVEVPKGRRTFCSDACVERWTIRTSPSKARELVYRRDKGVCAMCGWNTLEFEEKVRALVREADVRWRGGTVRVFDTETVYTRGPGRPDPEWCPYSYREGKAFAAVRDALFAEVGLDGAKYRHRRSFWDMDHIRPVVEGGGSCGLDNLRTLCLKCHGKVSAELAARRAAAGRGDARTLGLFPVDGGTG